MKVAVILSGCGVFDGAEIQESVLTLLYLSEQGIEYDIFAPDVAQAHVINHITGQEMDESRNVLTEAARIVRGNINPLPDYKQEHYSALCIPGGFGGAKNLSDLAFKGAELTILPEFSQAVSETASAGKPILALCIIPAVIAKLFAGSQLTIGNDTGTAEVVNALGTKHIAVDLPSDVVYDSSAKLITVPCYMFDTNILEVSKGIRAGIEKLASLLA